MTTKFCKQCNTDTERRNDGKCKPCAARYQTKYKRNNYEKVIASQAKYRMNNPGKGAECAAAYRKNNPEKHAAGVAKWQKNNPEKVRIIAAKWQKNNPEKAAEYRKNNSEKCAAAVKRWQINNADRVKENTAKWAKNNLERRAAMRQNRRARKLNAGGTHTPEDICSILAYQQGKCACCVTYIEGVYHVNHIEPLSKGGSNDRSNLQILCSSCNLSKHAKYPVEFMKQFFHDRVEDWASSLFHRREVLGF